MPRFYRRLGLSITTLACLALAIIVSADAKGPLDVEAALAERIVGDPAAPVTIIEYASFTCPLCAAFHTGPDYDGLKKRFIETGQVKLVFRDFPLDNVSLHASMVARCAGTEGYFTRVGELFATQKQWATADDPTADLAEITGLDDAMLTECLSSTELSDGLFRLRAQGATDGVLFTPTYIVNGTMYPGSHSVEEFSEIIEPLVADK
ncbi:MAG: DsbA family protein [Alphaproteobacteria bacterium]|nr:DsbA family protein [Alphaproteobacteria bacterium]